MNNYENFKTDWLRLGAEATADTLAAVFFNPDSRKNLRDEYRITAETTNIQLERMLKDVFDEIERTGCLFDEDGMPVSIDVGAARDYLHALRDERVEEAESDE